MKLKCENWLVATQATEESYTLKLEHESGVSLEGELSFVCGEEKWTLDDSRDGVANRPALLDKSKNVQGYVTFNASGDRLEILPIHRTAQFYAGTFCFSGTATLGDETFACCTKAEREIRVVHLASGGADSGHNDSLFDVQRDCLLAFSGADVALTSEAGKFHFELQGKIESAAAATLGINLVHDYYRNRYVPYYAPIDRARCPRPPTGWMSWNVYFDQAGSEENLAEARIGAEKLKPFGLEFWSIESWQDNSPKLPVGHFHNLNLKAFPEQFPEGMEKLAADIRELGLRPGIWTVPFGTGNEEFYKEHQEWFLHHPDGTPFTNWCGKFLLDPSQPEVIERMCETHRIMHEEWGYEFFKIDGMSGRSSGYCAHFYERDEVKAAFKNPCETPFEDCVRALRKGIGPDSVFLACQGHYSGAEAEFADASRIGGDIVSPNQPSKWHNIVSQGRATLNQLFVNNIVFYNDPDTLLVGENHEMEQARVTTTVVALPGQLNFFGDKLGELPPERMRMLQQTLPVCDIRPLDLFPVFTMAPVWDLKIRRDFAEWDVVALFNWTGEEAQIEADFEELGLGAGSYYGYEFWTDSYLGEIENRVSQVVPPRAVRLVALHRAVDQPQFISTDRHVTQGGVSLLAQSWDAASKTLQVELDLVGGYPFCYRFHVPAGLSLDAASSGSAEILSCKQDGELLEVSLCSKDSGSVELNLAFL